MADEDKKSEDSKKPPSGESGSEQPKSAGDGKATKAAPKKKSRKGLFIILGIAVFLGIATYAGVIVYDDYQKKQLAKKWGTGVLSEEEKKAQEEEKKEQELKKKEDQIQAFIEKKNIKRSYFDECQVMNKAYTPPKGWNYDTLPLQTILGLPKYVGEEAVNERCAEFSTTVNTMENLSRRKNHTYLCMGSRYKLPGGFYFEPDPKGRGIYQAHEALTRDKKFIRIKPGKSTIYAAWQFHNAGDGCIVVGHKGMKGEEFLLNKETVEQQINGR